MAENESMKETPGAEGLPDDVQTEPAAPVEPEAQEEVLPVPVADEEDTIAPSDVTSDDRLLSALMWLSLVLLQLPLLSGILLLIEPNRSRPFQRYHAIHSLIFWAAMLIYEGLAMIAFTILTAISLGCFGICGWLIFFVPHLLGLYYALKAFNGEEMEIPFITQFARNQGWV